MKICTLYVVRHGETTHNRDNIVSGHVNPSLTETGKQQAAATRDKLAHIQFDEAYSSDLERAVHTGSIIYGEPIPEQHQFAELRERNYGDFDGLDEHHLRNLYSEVEPEYSQLDESDKWTYKRHATIESDHELSQRFVGRLKQIANDNLGKTILVTAHGGTIRNLLVSIGYGTNAELPSGSVANASFVKLTYDGQTLTVHETSGINKLA